MAVCTSILRAHSGGVPCCVSPLRFAYQVVPLKCYFRPRPRARSFPTSHSRAACGVRRAPGPLIVAVLLLKGVPGAVRVGRRLHEEEMALVASAVIRRQLPGHAPAGGLGVLHRPDLPPRKVPRPPAI